MATDDTDRNSSAHRSTRQFTLRAFVAFFVLVNALLGVAVAVDWKTTAGTVVGSLAARALMIVLAGALVGFLVGNMGRATAAAAMGVVLADGVCGILLILMSTNGQFDTRALALNPLTVTAVIVCPLAAMRRLEGATAIGCLLSFIMPIAVSVVLGRLILSPAPPAPGDDGGGLVLFFLAAIALAGMFTGVLGFPLMRATLSLWDWLRHQTPPTRVQHQQFPHENHKEPSA